MNVSADTGRTGPDTATLRCDGGSTLNSPMTETCAYSHTGVLVTDWDCPRPAGDGVVCPFHTESAIPRRELSRLTRTEAVQADDGTIPAIGAIDETIPVDASAHSLDLREASTGIRAVGTEPVSGLDPSGATVTRVDLRRTTVAGEFRLTGADVGEMRLNQARVEKQLDCSEPHRRRRTRTEP